MSIDEYVLGNIPGTNYKDQAIKAARGLYYGKEVIEQIKAAKSDAEITRIMTNARHRKFDEK